MVLFDIGRVCIKIAGRESGQLAVIVDKKENMFLIDGNVRRKLCNQKHLEPLDLVLDIKKGATTSEVKNAMKKHGYEILEKKKKEKQKTEKPIKKRKNKKLEIKEPIKKEEKKTKKKNEK